MEGDQSHTQRSQARFSRSASSNGVVFVTRGSGVQSSTRSSISCTSRMSTHFLDPRSHYTHIFRQTLPNSALSNT